MSPRSSRPLQLSITSMAGLASSIVSNRFLNSSSSCPHDMKGGVVASARCAMARHNLPLASTGLHTIHNKHGSRFHIRPSEAR